MYTRDCTHLEEGLALSALVHEVLRVGLVLAVVKVHPKRCVLILDNSHINLMQPNKPVTKFWHKILSGLMC